MLTIAGLLLCAAAFTGAAAFTESRRAGNSAVLPLAFMSAGCIALALVVAVAGGRMGATPQYLSWRTLIWRTRIPAIEIRDLEVVTRPTGTWTRSWPLVRTATGDIELRKLQVGLDSTDKLQAALDEMKVVLGLGDGAVPASVVPPLRVRRPTSWLFIAVLGVLVWLGFNSSWVGLDLSGPLALVVFGVGAAVVGYLISWLRGSSVVIDETSVRQVGGTERSIPIAEVVGFRVDRRASGLTAAVLLVDTTAGEVTFDGMVATWGQTMGLEAIATQLNERLHGSQN
ncbi:hypothetical protein GCM10009668_13600 [Nocardioides dubius]|uniref:PH domain-containing protein n=1 Tax=Nocardioides dubius TaxID=317019 RepID=A0ABP4E8P0_9ACTN